MHLQVKVVSFLLSPPIRRGVLAKVVMSSRCLIPRQWGQHCIFENSGKGKGYAYHPIEINIKTMHFA